MILNLIVFKLTINPIGKIKNQYQKNILKIINIKLKIIYC